MLIRAKMANKTRQEQILELLQLHTSASIPEMAERFRVSEMTIRRDLEDLYQSSRVIRIPNGAMIAQPVTFERSFQERLRTMGEAKDRIGRAAASLIKPGEAVVLDSGTTTLCIARHLHSVENVIVITYSLAVLGELAADDSARVELTGGTYRHSSHDLVGAQVSEGLRRVSTNKVFLGAAALSFKKGVMQFDSEAPRELLQAGAERILVLDSGKIGKEALYSFCTVESCSLVVTDSGISHEHLERLRRICRVLVAQ
jgi:DeoR/GlpR family transcriptional regulator of sugar metabolism